MNIINSNLIFKGLDYSNVPRMIILHHAAALKCSIEDIHRWHLNNGWSGCGYHYFIRKDGRIYVGRNEKAIGAHCINYNSVSIGICLEGNFDTEKMGEVQYKALVKLSRYICSKYNINKIYGHGELNATNCPGRNFSLERLGSDLKVGAEVESYPGYLLKFNPSVKDKNVELLQSKLIEKAYSVGACGADGYFGKDTLLAIKRFQRDNGLLVDGVVGRESWGKILKYV
ncbi:N-acetylmuramoyl-L-alanine amidase [Clostridium sp. MSJ-11]|uniref:N-acetylmuramoyl-L-alanine amidase n=1 Tax=Clostridium mobile TaxID=2841512 RepID=A0ABS6EG77_9CLOT|nr:N-acetylmuramoyl-L-alanine amidase [Clostridium mobile]MBU5484152.1 N-acetylmuramoyl-L-alanine amidase [Clostridium mobile]